MWVMDHWRSESNVVVCCVSDKKSVSTPQQCCNSSDPWGTLESIQGGMENKSVNGFSVFSHQRKIKIKWKIIVLNKNIVLNCPQCNLITPTLAGVHILFMQQLFKNSKVVHGAGGSQ